MKLEAGQRIGIYEVLDIGVFKQSLLVNSNHLGFKTKGLHQCVYLFDTRMPDVPYPMHDYQVKKVGTLIVKKVK